MSVVTIRPNAAGSLRGSWTTTGAGGVMWTALSDDNNATYTALSGSYTAGVNGAAAQLNLGTTTIPAGARIKSVTPWVVAARTGSTSRKINLRLHNPRVLPKSDWQKTSTHVLTQTPTRYTGLSEDTEITRGLIAIAPRPISQETINSFQLEVYGMTTTDVRIYEMGVDIVLDLKPVTSNLAVNGLGDGGVVDNTRTPTITWEYTDDLEDQSIYDIEIFTTANVSVFKTTVNSSNDYHFLTEALANGSYYIRMRTAHPAGADGAALWSDFVTMSFTVNLPNPAVPTVYAMEDSANGRAVVAVYNKLNMLSQSAAQPESNSWDYLLYSATLTDETGPSYVYSGGNSIRVTFTSSTPSLGTYPSIRVTPGQIYGAAAYVRKIEASTVRNAFISIDYYDIDIDYLGSTNGASIPENGDNWTKIEVKSTAPADAVYASVTVYFQGGSAGQVHFVDAPILVALEELTTPIPAWSRGGLTTDTPNLLSYADSTMEGTYNWFASEPTSTISVDPAGPDLNTVQGTLALAMQTTDIGGRRDSEGFTGNNVTAFTANRGDVLSGDFMIAFVTLNSPTPTITAPAGWTLYATQTAGSTVKSAVYYKVAGGSEPSTYTWTSSAAAKGTAWIYSRNLGEIAGTPIIVSGYAVASVTTSTTTFNMPAVATPHNGVLIQAVGGVRAAATTAATWTSNLGAGAAYEAQLGTTANTANEATFGAFVQLQNTKTTSDTNVSGKTLTSSAALAQAVTWSIVLQPLKTTVRADLAGGTIKYPVTPGDNYVINAAVYGANGNSANRRFSVWMDLFDANGTFITAYGYRPYVIPGQWVNGGSVIPIPSNPAITQASLRLEVDQMTSLETYYVDAMSLYPGDEYLGYYEGYRNNVGPFTETEYSEDMGLTWKPISPEPLTPVQPGNAVDTIFDYEVGSEEYRMYRSRNIKTEDDILYVSDWAVSDDEVILTFDNVWMHVRQYPGETIRSFIFDEGRGRGETISNAGAEIRLYGREYPVVQYSARTEKSFSVSLRCIRYESLDADLIAFRTLASTKGEIIYRDARGRRYTGWMDGIQITDEVWGAMVSFTFKVAGLQP